MSLKFRGAKRLGFAASITGLVAATVLVTGPASPAAAQGTCPNAGLRAANNSSDLPDCRAYEMASPADKAGGTGLGLHEPQNGDLNEGWLLEHTVLPVTPSLDGNRLAMTASKGGLLIAGAAVYQDDTALAARGPDGWSSHSPFTHHDHNPLGGLVSRLNYRAVSDDLSTIGWVSSTSAYLFAEQNEWPGGISSLYISDFSGRWEPLAPTDPSQGRIVGSDTVLVSGDGSHAVTSTATLRGLTGSGDPSVDLPSGAHAVFADNVSTGLSDEFPGAGKRSLVNVCTGEGAERTRIPLRDDSGSQGARACPPADPGRDAALISDGGASIAPGTTTGDLSPTTRAVSHDGSRIFFMSPDPGYGGAPAACTGTGTGTSCPPQLYVREEAEDGEFATRWISQTEVADQDASLMAPVYYEGASRDGDKVYFRTSAPLTTDDPNGIGAPVSAGVTTGIPDPASWDLYEYDFTDDSDDDPGAGDLTRISAGPDGDADANVHVVAGGNFGGGLRFVSADGDRVYFTTAAPIPGVPASTNGSSTSPGGSPTAEEAANLYLYDSSEPEDERWQFVARLPRSTEPTDIRSCATTSIDEGQPVDNLSTLPLQPSGRNCLRGTDDGRFITFWTDGRLLPDDQDDLGDIYAFDQTSDRLIRISAAHGGTTDGYPCEYAGGGGPTLHCAADPGFGAVTVPVPYLGVATNPRAPNDRIAFFQSKAQLVQEDINDEYDVYRWRNGELALVSTGTAATGAFYGGNSTDGRDVFLMTKQALTWQDSDAEMDAYDARVGGGFPPPAAGQPCDVLADECQPLPAPAPPADDPGTPDLVGPGNPETGTEPNRCARLDGKAKRADRRADKRKKRFKKLKRKARKLDRKADRASGKRARRLDRKAERKQKQARKAKRKTKRAKRKAKRTKNQAKRCKQEERA